MYHCLLVLGLGLQSLQVYPGGLSAQHSIFGAANANIRHCVTKGARAPCAVAKAIAQRQLRHELTPGEQIEVVENSRVLWRKGRGEGRRFEGALIFPTDSSWRGGTAGADVAKMAAVRLGAHVATRSSPALCSLAVCWYLFRTSAGGEEDK